LFTLRFDMRAPAWGAPKADLYAAVPEMCAWAEDHGGLAAVLCEHHGSEDGYLPSPLLLASAIAARTQRISLSLILLLLFYDPVRLAEDMAVLDIISRGRASYILALGYRPEEFEQFGLSLGDRGRLADEKLGLLRQLLTDETVVHDGRRITVTPRPNVSGGPAMMWGGGTVAAARRAGRYGLGMLANANVAGMAASRGRRSFPTVTSTRCVSSPTTWTGPGRSSAGICCTTCKRMPHGTPATTRRRVSRT
jgi:alkanesulfonate monooxygenase SsuD/methylene tetrahydromethanopterin reductase-like flavin-dependent oxidoreductase (luciferase family)